MELNEQAAEESVGLSKTISSKILKMAREQMEEEVSEEAQFRTNNNSNKTNGRMAISSENIVVTSPDNCRVSLLVIDGTGIREYRCTINA